MKVKRKYLRRYGRVDKEIEYHALSIILLESDTPQELQSVFKVFCILHSIVLVLFPFSCQL